MQLIMMTNEKDINIKNTHKQQPFCWVRLLSHLFKDAELKAYGMSIAMLLILVFLFFSGTLSAQDNYTIIVKCYPANNNRTGYAMHAYGSHHYTCTTKSGRTTRVHGTAHIGTKKTFILTTGNISAYMSSSSTITGRTNSTFTGTGPVIYYSSVIGWGDFSITNINTCQFTLSPMSFVFYQSLNSNNTITYFNPSVSPPAYTSSADNTISYVYGNWTVSGDCYSYYTQSMCNYYSSLNTASNSGTGWKTNTLATARLSSALADGRTDFMLVVSSNSGRFQAYPAGNSNQPYLKVQYAAPWSCVISPLARPNTSSVCANDGVFTLSASQSYNSNYISVSATSWEWYSATVGSNGPYSPMGGTNMSTYAVTAPSNTGSIWYRFNQSLSLVSNSTLETMSNTYSITYCSPGSVYVSLCCTPLDNNPTFSATQISDRSVTLNWNGMSNVDHFVIRYGTEGGVSFEEISVPGSITSTTINELTNGHTYYFQIRAISSSSDYCDTPLSTKVPLTPVCNE